MRILIVEEALRAGNGHWPRYIADLAAGFRAEGDIVDVLGHKEANEKVKSVVHGVVPWLSRDCRIDRRSQGLIGGIRHNICIIRELRAWLNKREPYDWILSLSSRPKHLLAFAMLASAKQYSLSRFLLLFVLGPGQRDDGGNFCLSASNLFARFCFALLHPAIRRGQVVLAAETEGMVKEVESFSGLPGVLFPHPVVMPEGAARLPMSDGGGLMADKSKLVPCTSTVPEAFDLDAGCSTQDLHTSAKPIVVVAPGLARYEKGSDMFQDAIKLVLKNEANSAPIRFVMQWMEDFDLPDGRRCGPDPELLHDDRIEFANELLTGNAYLDFLRRADLIVLPYRSESYRVRVSRVAIEAAILGKPLVYTEATWTREVGAMVGSGVAVGVESAAALAEALREALPRLAHLQAGAVKGASRVRDFYSVRRFRVNLTEEA